MLRVVSPFLNGPWLIQHASSMVDVNLSTAASFNLMSENLPYAPGEKNIVCCLRHRVSNTQHRARLLRVAQLIFVELILKRKVLTMTSSWMIYPQFQMAHVFPNLYSNSIDCWEQTIGCHPSWLCPKKIFFYSGESRMLSLAVIILFCVFLYFFLFFFKFHFSGEKTFAFPISAYWIIHQKCSTGISSRVLHFQKHSALELQSEQLAAPYTQPAHALGFPACPGLCGWRVSSAWIQIFFLQGWGQPELET